MTFDIEPMTNSPEHDAFWTLGMAVSWIVERSFRTMLRDVAIIDLLTEEWGDDVADEGNAMTPAYAKPNLWRALSEGKLKATGQPNDGSRQTISAELWQDLVMHTFNSDSLREGPRGIVWEKITVAQTDVIRIWPAGNADAVAGIPKNSIIQPIAGKIAATVQIIRELWPNGIPAGFSAKGRNATISQKYQENACGTVSDRTIVTAIRKLKT